MAISQVCAMQVNGTLYDSVPPNAKASGAGGNGGAATRTANSPLLDLVNVSRYNSMVFGSTVVNGTVTDKALNAGTFAYNNQSPVAKRLTSELSGVSNAVLLSGAGQPALIRSIHGVETVRTRRFCTAIRANTYNRFTNVWEAGYPVVATDNIGQATDVAAHPTRDVPGHLTFKGGQTLPVTVNYKPKTGG